MSIVPRGERGVAIVDFGLGNLRSLERKLKVAGFHVQVVSDAATIVTASHLILPGIGHFGPAMEQLVRSGLSGAILEAVEEHSVPILGICLGMQLLTDGSEESGTAGLGLIPGRTVHLGSLAPKGFPVPHIGWATVSWRAERFPTGSVSSALDCYFSHSYHVVCSEEQVLATASYGADFVAAVLHGKAAGVQFHPEKSHRGGINRLAELIVAQRPMRAPE